MAVALVVDDEFLIAAELEAILSSAGYEVLTAVNVAEARDLVDGRRIDVSVLDFRMGKSAHDLARDLRSQGVPLMFCTGSMPDEVRTHFDDVTVIGKPFDADELLSHVNRLAGR